MKIAKRFGLRLALSGLLAAPLLLAQSKVPAPNMGPQLYRPSHRSSNPSSPNPGSPSYRSKPSAAQQSVGSLGQANSIGTSIMANFDRALIKGALTHVPASANPGFTRLLDGAPLVVDSRITGVDFHVPGKISSRTGGLSAVPRPLLKVENGVAYWQITGELSGLFTDEFGIRLVYGPIDPSGKSHRSETFGPGAHPRAGLPGALFVLQVPVKSWNGRLAQLQCAADGGFGNPACPYLANAVDPIVLLDRGYAVFSFGAGGTVPLGDLPDGTSAVDTNPESGTGIAWKAPVDMDHLVSYVRPANADQNGNETAFPSPFVINVWDPFAGDVVPRDIGDPGFFFGNLQIYPEPVSDSVIFARNLLRSFTGHSPNWTAYIGWSGSGPNALMINSSTRGGYFQTPRSQGVQAGGGNYNVWGDPKSGLRFDAFMVYAAASQNHSFFGEGEWLESEVHPKQPISAPIAWVLGDSDVNVPQSEPYIYANSVTRALKALGRGDKVNDSIRIYAVPKLTHLVREGFANFDRPISQDALWYKYSPDYPNPGSLNTQHQGLRVADAFARALPFNQPFDDWEVYPFHFEARAGRSMPLLLQILTNLQDRTEHNIAMPKSRVHPNFFSSGSSLSANIPPYPDPGCVIGDDFFGSGVECSRLTTEDSASPTFPLSQHEIDELTYFATQNPLQRSTDPLILPDIAAPLGTRLFYFNAVLENPYTTEQLRQRYGNHDGYVRTFETATKEMVRARLWDVGLGALYLDEVKRSSVLRGLR